MIIFDGFWAGCVCGISGMCIFILIISIYTYVKQTKAKAEVMKLINTLDEAANEVIEKGDRNKNESNN